jgi:hypothetical protein
VLRTDDPDPVPDVHRVQYEAGTKYGWGAREARSGRVRSCAISAKAPTVSLWPERKEYGPSRRVSFTRAKKRAEVSVSNTWVE